CATLHRPGSGFQLSCSAVSSPNRASASWAILVRELVSMYSSLYKKLGQIGSLALIGLVVLAVCTQAPPVEPPPECGATPSHRTSSSYRSGVPQLPEAERAAGGLCQCSRR